MSRRQVKPIETVEVKFADRPFSEYLEAWREVRFANTDGRGRVKNQAMHYRLEDAFRAECIKRLGWKAEDLSADAGQRYAASAGEMKQWLLEAEQVA